MNIVEKKKSKQTDLIERFIHILFHYKTKFISENMYCNFLEAIIGAVYLDKGLKVTKEVVKRLILTGEEATVKNKDFKSELYLLAKKHKQKINFVQMDQKGPDHKKSHKIGHRGSKIGFSGINRDGFHMKITFPRSVCVKNITFD